MNWVDGFYLLGSVALCISAWRLKRAADRMRQPTVTWTWSNDHQPKDKA